MNREILQAFLEKVRGDAAIQARFQDAKCERCVVALAQESGFDFDEDAVAELLNGQSLDSLKGVVAGAGGDGSSEGSIWPMPRFE